MGLEEIDGLPGGAGGGGHYLDGGHWLTAAAAAQEPTVQVHAPGTSSLGKPLSTLKEGNTVLVDRLIPQGLKLHSII